MPILGHYAVGTFLILPLTRDVNLFPSSNGEWKSRRGMRPSAGLQKKLSPSSPRWLRIRKGHVDRIRGGDLEFRSGQCLSDLDLKVLLLSSNRGTHTVWIAKNME